MEAERNDVTKALIIHSFLSLSLQKKERKEKTLLTSWFHSIALSVRSISYWWKFKHREKKREIETYKGEDNFFLSNFPMIEWKIN